MKYEKPILIDLSENEQGMGEVSDCGGVPEIPMIVGQGFKHKMNVLQVVVENKFLTPLL